MRAAAALPPGRKTHRIPTQKASRVQGVCDQSRSLETLGVSPFGTYATFPDGRRKAAISPKPDIAGLLSVLVYAFTP